MDSLTQIVLGAAVGEVVLGKKVGNRAMLWGAVGGTIPDLDIIGNLWMDEVSALAFHRGISHSFFFAILSPFFFGWLVDKLYSNDIYRSKGYKLLVMSIIIFVMGVFTIGPPFMILGKLTLIPGLISLTLTTLVVLWLRKKYFMTELAPVNATRMDWTWLFFGSIVTHPILDAFTAYGTQLFQPFSNYRVAWDVISVADPLYTVPFLICLIIAACIVRTSPRRRFFNYLGIAISSAYMIFCAFHKMKVDQIFEQSLVAEKIEYQRLRVTPTIFNNILWSGIVEGEDSYYQGFYSFNDKEPKVTFQSIAKNHEKINGYEDTREVHILRWFSDNYFNVIVRRDGQLQLNDLRYGVLGEGIPDENDYIFKFILSEKEGQLEVHQSREVDRGGDGDENPFAELIERIKGK